MEFEVMWKDLQPLGRTAHGGYRRQPFTAIDHELRHWFRTAAEDRGMKVEEDGFGNLFAWWGGLPTPESRGILTGSHLDSVVDGGAYDGPLGVVSGFAAVDLLQARGVVPTQPLGVAAFAEEEGSRFGLACLGSRLATGALTWEQARELRDPAGVWLRDAMASVLAHPGVGPTTGLADRLDTFVELHVEQGRYLVDRDAPIGLASMIWPHGRYRFDVTGEANHAGSTRMEDRHDPMLTFAMTALAANKQARLAGQRATFGRVEVVPNGTNAIPSRVTAWLDARAESDAALAELVSTVSEQALQRAGRDGTHLVVTPESETPAVHFDRALVELLGEGRAWPVLPTAAGHDAGVIAQAGVPTAMLFVRNPSGVSHAPDEFARPEDCLAGVDALADVLERLMRTR